MSECKFKNIPIGETVTFDTNNLFCFLCEQSIPDTRITGIYKEHITDETVYDVVEDIYLVCPNCNNVKTRFLTNCHEGGVWIINEKYIEETV